MKRKSLLLAAFLIVAGSAFAEKFSICVIPDIQKYTFHKTQEVKGYPISGEAILYKQMEWVAENGINNGGPLVFAIQLGDLVEEPLFDVEWRRADKALSMLDGALPYCVTPGNHDTDKIIKGDLPWKVTTFNKYDKLFGKESKHFKNADWHLGSYDQANSLTTFSADGYDFLVVSLEMQPRDETLEWLDKVLDEHKNMPTIIDIHAYINKGNKGPYLYDNNKCRKDEIGNTPKQLWEKCLSNHSQVFMVVSGHFYGESMLKQKNKAGYDVFAIHSDYEGYREIIDRDIGTYPRATWPSADGWLRIMTFDIENKRIDVETYSPELDRYQEDADSKFTITWTWDWNERFGAE